MLTFVIVDVFELLVAAVALQMDVSQVQKEG
jgi:hypothetical protein